MVLFQVEVSVPNEEPQQPIPKSTSSTDVSELKQRLERIKRLAKSWTSTEVSTLSNIIQYFYLCHHWFDICQLSVLTLCDLFLNCYESCHMEFINIKKQIWWGSFQINYTCDENLFTWFTSAFLMCQTVELWCSQILS